MTRWHHNMEILFALLALCEGNPPEVDSPHKGPAMQILDIFVVVSLNELLSCHRFETSCDIHCYENAYFLFISQMSSIFIQTSPTFFMPLNSTPSFPLASSPSLFSACLDRNPPIMKSLWRTCKNKIKIDIIKVDYQHVWIEIPP